MHRKSEAHLHFTRFIVTLVSAVITSRIEHSTAASLVLGSVISVGIYMLVCFQRNAWLSTLFTNIFEAAEIATDPIQSSEQ